MFLINVKGTYMCFVLLSTLANLAQNNDSKLPKPPNKKIVRSSKNSHYWSLKMMTT